MGADSGALGRASRLRAWLGRGPLLRGGAGADATLQRRRSRSDIRRLLNGDMEIALSAGAPPNPLADSMDFEVTPATPPKIVWRFPDGAFAYRAFRLPSLYPGVTWRTVP
jgi:hypothetical protein